MHTNTRTRERPEATPPASGQRRHTEAKGASAEHTRPQSHLRRVAGGRVRRWEGVAGQGAGGGRGTHLEMTLAMPCSQSLVL